MKGHFAAAVAVMAGGAAANHRHAHELFAKRGHQQDLCTTVWSTITGEPTRTHSSRPAERTARYGEPEIVANV